MSYSLVFESMLNFADDEKFEEKCIELKEKETELLKKSGYDYLVYKLSEHVGITTLDYLDNDCVQAMATKDGVDMIKFKNGHLGYVAYYGNHLDFLELAPITKEQYNYINDLYSTDADVEEYLTEKYFK